MAGPRKTYRLEIMGNGINEIFDGVVKHNFLGLPATTYIHMEFISGVEIDFNDFGVRSVRRVEPV